MSSLDDTFKMAGVTTVRDKILALVSAPELFFTGGYSEDYYMIHNVCQMVGNMFADYVAPNNFKVQFHIKCVLFDAGVPEQHRRNIVYSMRDPKYLDALIAWARKLNDDVVSMQTKTVAAVNELLRTETNVPVMKTLTEYRGYHCGAKV